MPIAYLVVRANQIDSCCAIASRSSSMASAPHHQRLIESSNFLEVVSLLLVATVLVQLQQVHGELHADAEDISKTIKVWMT